jgi:hypothetical protein
MAKIKAPKPHRWAGYKRTNNITLSNDKKEVIVYKQMFHNLFSLIFTLVSESLLYQELNGRWMIVEESRKARTVLKPFLFVGKSASAIELSVHRVADNLLMISMCGSHWIDETCTTGGSILGGSSFPKRL